VFSKFLKDIENGLTPNPDVLCNKYVKFGAFTDYIFENHPEMEFVATGHYADTVKKDGK
jgi:tRNA-specific 2-thiouridylase